MQTPQLTAQRLFRFVFPGCALFAVSLAWAQTASPVQNDSGTTAPTAPAASNPPAQPTKEKSVPVEAIPSLDQSDIVKLSPFEVSADKDNGYSASDTLSGTRIATRLEDLGASISVVTKQQMIDMASVDINDIFKYEANTEGTSDYTAQLSSAPTNDQIQSSPQTAVRVRGLGAPNMSRDGFSMTSRIPVDTYSLESIEISRGPNSTLAGLGNPSGTVNLSTATADVNRESTTLTMRADSFGGWRTTINLNRPIFRTKLAVRIAVLESDAAFVRKPSYDDQKRLFGTLTYKPFTKTTIRFQYEHYRDDRQTPNFLTPRDDVTAWVAAGKPTWNPLTWTATANGVTSVLPYSTSTINAVPGTAGALPAGLLFNSTNMTRPSMYIDGGQVQLWEINRLAGANANTQTSNEYLLQGSGNAFARGNVNPGGVAYQVPGINNKALYDWTKINAVPENWNYDHASLYTAIVEQQLLPDLYFRGAWHLEASDSYNRNIVNPPALEVDTNQYLLDGRANPYFLRPFYQASEPTIFRTPEYNDNVQAQLAYDLNFVKIAGPNRIWRWLGDHRLLGYYEGRHITDDTIRYREAIDDPNHVWLTAGSLNYSNGAAVDRPTYRYYVGPVGALGFVEGFTPPKSGVQGTFNLNYNNSGNTAWISEPAQFGQVTYVGGRTRQEVVSRGGVIQSSFLDNRIVFVGGLRKDFNRTRSTSGASINTTTGLYDYGNSNNVWGNWTSATGKTRTLSLVVKPLPWIGLTADQSASFAPQPRAIDLYDDVLPNTYGHGKDLGFFLSFYHDKLRLRLTSYKNTIDNGRGSNTTIGSRILRLESATSASADPESLLVWAQASANVIYGSTTSPDALAFIAAKQNYPAFLNNTIAASNAGVSVVGTASSEAKGGELSIDYNPTYNLNFRFTGAQTKSINTTIENDVASYIALRMPYWLSVNDGQGHYWWTDTRFTTSTAISFYTGNILNPLEIDQALLGKSNPQVKEYTWRALGTYRFTEGWLKNWGFGGSLRWDSKSSIGYYGAPADPDGIVRSLNVNASVWDPARYSGELHTFYATKIYRGKIGLRVQLNWDNCFQTSGLRVTSVNPDGTPYNFRIIDPQQFILTTTLTF